jgi:hypothetical protein
MGVDALLANGMTHKIKYLLQDKHLTSRRDPLRKVRKSRIWLFLAVQLIGFGATFAITQTIGGLIYIINTSLPGSPNIPPSSRYRISRYYHAAASSSHSSCTPVTLHK